jgi:hypothetical protein
MTLALIGGVRWGRGLPSVQRKHLSPTRSVIEVQSLVYSMVIGLSLRSRRDACSEGINMRRDAGLFQPVWHCP